MGENLIQVILPIKAIGWHYIFPEYFIPPLHSFIQQLTEHLLFGSNCARHLKYKNEYDIGP